MDNNKIDNKKTMEHSLLCSRYAEDEADNYNLNDAELLYSSACCFVKVLTDYVPEHEYEQVFKVMKDDATKLRKSLKDELIIKAPTETE